MAFTQLEMGWWLQVTSSATGFSMSSLTSQKKKKVSSKVSPQPICFCVRRHSFKSLKHNQPSKHFILLIPKRLNLKDPEPVLQKKKKTKQDKQNKTKQNKTKKNHNFTQSRLLRGEKMHQLHKYSWKLCHKTDNLTAFFYW